MSSVVPRTKVENNTIVYPPKHEVGSAGKTQTTPSITEGAGTITSKLWKSEGNPVNRNTGKRESGGPFHVTHTGTFCEPGKVSKIVNSLGEIYSGPVRGTYANSAHKSNYKSEANDKDVSDLDADGATAIALCAPNNPSANLSVSLAESLRDGIPSLPGIEAWKRKSGLAKSAGSEYLNYQFGWAPLLSEVHNVVNATRYQRDIMQNYRHNEGRNVHRRFDFPDEIQQWEEEVSPQNAIGWPGGSSFQSFKADAAKRVTVVRNVRKRWFEGCFTYGGPAKADNFGRHLGFGTDADALYGLNLSPDILWEAAPWSWAVDWFTNAGDVIHNVSNFAAAGLVMRYGYMMEETISETYTQTTDSPFRCLVGGESGKESVVFAGSCREGYRNISKTRGPANPFGFGVGWEGLSPTQLAITAAIGITRFLK